MSKKILGAGQVFTDASFGSMSWHDCRVYGIDFPKEDYSFALAIDYIFEWLKKTEDGYSGFLVAPCKLSFFNVSELEISISQGGDLTFSIEEVTRENERTTPNGKLTEWRYMIRLENGLVSFFATGYSMVIEADASVSPYQDLGRK